MSPPPEFHSIQSHFVTFYVVGSANRALPAGEGVFPLAVAAAPPGWRGGRWTPSRDRSPPGVPSGMSKDSARHADPDDAALRPTGTAWTGTRRVTPLRHAGHHPRAVGPGGADNAAALRVGDEGERDRGRHSAGLAPSPERPGPWRVTYGRLGRAPGRLVRAGPACPSFLPRVSAGAPGSRVGQGPIAEGDAKRP
jgi:hypothetical protein